MGHTKYAYSRVDRIWVQPFKFWSSTLLLYIRFYYFDRVCLEVLESIQPFTLLYVRLNLANVRAKVILIGHWSDHKKIPVTKSDCKFTQFAFCNKI